MLNSQFVNDSDNKYYHTDLTQRNDDQSLYIKDRNLFGT